MIRKKVHLVAFRDKTLLSAVSARPLNTTLQSNRSRNNVCAETKPVIIHQVQPSTSYERQTSIEQQQPRVPISYQNSYQLSQYAVAQETETVHRVPCDPHSNTVQEVQLLFLLTIFSSISHDRSVLSSGN